MNFVLTIFYFDVLDIFNLRARPNIVEVFYEGLKVEGLEVGFILDYLEG